MTARALWSCDLPEALRWRTPPWWRDAIGPRPIVMLTTSYPAGPRSIAGHFVQTLAARLRAEGHAVWVLTPASGAGPWSRPSAETTDAARVIRAWHPGWRRAPFHRDGLPERLERGDLSAFATLPASLGALALATHRAATQAGPRAELVGHWLAPGGWLAQRLARTLRLSATTVCHSGATRLAATLPPPLARSTIANALGAGPYVITCRQLLDVLTAPFAPQARSALRARAHVAPMPIPTPQRAGSPPDGPPWRVLVLGRLTPVKGLARLLDALTHHAVRDLVELHVCGDGPLRAALQARCAASGLSARFHGVVVGADKARLLSTCHGFALPSVQVARGRTEGVPVALLEALSYGLPCWVSPVGGAAEVLQVSRERALAMPAHGAPSLDNTRAFIARMAGAQRALEADDVCA